MFAFILRRLLQAVAVMLTVALLAFVLFQYVGDPVTIMLGQDATDAERVELRERLGLNEPAVVQFGHFVANAAQGNFGISLRQSEPVSSLLKSRLPATLELSLVAAVLALVVGVPLGVYTALKRNSMLSQLLLAGSLLGVSLPTFLIGILLILVFSVQLGWLPTVWADSWRHYILPSLTLGAGVAAVMARFTRSSFIDILKEDYVRTARAKGLSETVVVVKHGLRNALIPVVTMMGLQFGFLLGGSIVVEVVFNWPGMGRLLVDAVDMRDYPVIQALVLLFSLEFILINLVVDLLYALINPTIRFK